MKELSQIKYIYYNENSNKAADVFISFKNAKCEQILTSSFTNFCCVMSQDFFELHI